MTENDLISRSAPIDRYYAEYEKQDICDGDEDRDWLKKCIEEAPAVDAVERKKLIKKLFPMGVPKTREEWSYSINARAVYEAIMKTEG